MTNPIYAVLLFISGAISLAIAVIAWKRRPSVGAAALAVTMLSMAIWAWMYGLYWIAPTRSEKFVLLSLSFIGVVISSPAFLVMAVQFSGKTEWPTRRIIFLLSILPVLILFSLWTEPWFDLFSGGVDFLDPRNSLQGGVGIVLSALNAYGTTIIAFYFLLRAYKSANHSRRGQIVMILVGTSFPFVAGYLSILKLSPFPDLDLTSIAFSLSGICYAYALFGYKMMDLAPMGRETIIEEMDSGIFVVDHLRRIIDINPSALSFLGFSSVKQVIGKPLKEVLPKWIDTEDLAVKVREGETRFEFEGRNNTYYNILISRLLGANGEITGFTYIMQDISEQKSTEEELRFLNSELENQLNQIRLLHAQLQEKAIRDSLTGCYNRGYMEETVVRELASVKRQGLPLSLLMIDIDKFKHLNDTYGHSAGDKILIKFCDLILRNTRQHDIGCRYGGDEFVVVMPGISLEEAIMRGKQLMELFSEHSFMFENTEVHTSLSIGVATFPEHGNTLEQLLFAADKALYVAKKKRNVIVSAGSN